MYHPVSATEFKCVVVRATAKANRSWFQPQAGLSVLRLHVLSVLLWAQIL